MDAGDKLGTYEILAPIGAGGMGEVYRARDTKLKRDVALKVLPEAFAKDPGRMLRFQREAEVLASLNHPNIAHIYGVEERALVMEMVEGESPKGPMPFEEAWRIASQIAAALEYAHDKGIIHRDLKPANVKVTPDGVAKLLDFGLAKAFSETPEAGSADPENSPTVTLGATVAGTVMGTAAYMSPEQAKGKKVDKRADIWSWGVVLYELLTGERLFKGGETADTLAQVLTKEPPLERVPPQMRKLLRRCLEKDPKQRLRDIGEARYLLDEPAAQLTIAPAWSRLDWATAASLLLIALALGFGWWRATRPVDRPLMWLNVDLGPNARAGRDFTAAISPDGTRLVFPIGDAGASRLAVRSLGQPNATPLAGTEGGDNPFFSPDGEWVAFGAGGKLKKISIHGGPPTTLCDAPAFRGGTWGEDGFIVASFGNGSGLSRVPENSGSPERLTKLENGEVTHRWPQILPGRKAVLFSANSSQTNWEEAHVEVLSLKTGERKTVVRGGFYGRYLPSGHLVYLRGATLYGMAFDMDRLERAGPPAALLEGIPASMYGGGQFDFSRNGTLVYLTENPSIEAGRKLVWIDAAGKTQPFFAGPARFFNAPALSPDGKRLAIAIGDVAGSDLWVYDLEREIPTKLRTGGRVLLGAVWAPDGKHLVYGTPRSSNNGVMWIRADGDGEPQQLTRDDTHEQIPSSVSPDGRSILFGTQVTGPGGGVQSLTIDTTDPDHPKAGAPEPLPSTSRMGGVTVSPDDHWIAYTSDASGTPQVFVRPFGNSKIAGSGAQQISSTSGAYPVWSRAARQLLYVTLEGRVMVVDYTVEGDSFHGLKPRLWTDKLIGTTAGSIRFGGGRPPFDLTQDGRRIIAWEPEEQPKETMVNLHVTMLLNWFDELRRRLPPSGK
jgi:serine/threonine-protein kinase